MEIKATPPGLSSADAGRVDAFASVAAAVARSSDLDTALDLALDGMLAALALPAGGIYLVDDETGALVATAHHRGLPPGYPEAVQRFGRGEGPMGRALQSVAPVAVRDLGQLEGVRAATRAIGLRAIAFVP